MNKRHLTAAVITAIALSLTCSSCIGSFAAFNKVLKWNHEVSDKKWVNELVFAAFWVLPVYELCGLADVLVLNSIEFWTGDNPVDENVVMIDGKDAQYRVETAATGYTITNMATGDVTRLNFDAPNRTWSVSVDGTDVPFLTWIDDTHAIVPDATGTWAVATAPAGDLYARR